MIGEKAGFGKGDSGGFDSLKSQVLRGSLSQGKRDALNCRRGVIPITI